MWVVCICTCILWFQVATRLSTLIGLVNFRDLFIHTNSLGRQVFLSINVKIFDSKIVPTVLW